MVGEKYKKKLSVKSCFYNQIKNHCDKAGSRTEKDKTTIAATGGTVQALYVVSLQEKFGHVSNKFSITGNVREGLTSRETCHL